MTKIITSRLQLRLITILDLQAIHELHSLPETDTFNTLGIPENSQKTEQIIENWLKEDQAKSIKNYVFAIETQSKSEFIGLFGLKIGAEKFKSAEIWYKIHPKFWRQGLATESVKSVLNFGFETLQLHRIVAGCAVENLGSIRVLEKSGMQREGRSRKILPLKSGWSDNFVYSILESDKRL